MGPLASFGESHKLKRMSFRFVLRVAAGGPRIVSIAAGFWKREQRDREWRLVHFPKESYTPSCLSNAQSLKTYAGTDTR